MKPTSYNIVLFIWLSVFISACNDSPVTNEAPVESETPEVTQGIPVYGTWGVDLTARNEAVKPGDDFHQYANGNWFASNEIPEERVSYGVMLIVHERAEERVKAIIEELGAAGGLKGSSEQKVGDYYASWMDIEAVNKLGIKPLQPDLDRIAAISSVDELTAEFGHLYYVNGISPISTGFGIDPRDPDRYNYNVGLGGMGLPDRDYYLDESDQFKSIRDSYKKHIARMLDFAAVEASSEKAQQILALETKIAGYQWVRSDRRDRDKTFNPTSVAQLKIDYTNFNWDLFLSSGNIRDIEEVNVNHPDTINPLIDLINSEPLETWKTYLTYHSISNNASALSEEIDSANFEFWGKVLGGQQQQLARWKRGVARVGAKTGLGEALGQIYVKRHFPKSSKAKMDQLVAFVRAAYEERINTLDWMGEETKKEARAKLATFRPKIGYPDQWLDLSAITIERGDYFGNARRITKFFEDYDVARLTRPTDKDEWFMMPQTVNAYYNPSFNEIVFPAAILEAPFFDPNADAAVNYGSIGAVIGHEMGHGFDDQGSKSDANGVKRNWWTVDDRKAFEARTARLGDQYSSYEAVPDNFVDGKFTMGENIGDLGGVAVAYHAYQLSLEGKEQPIIDGMTGTQRFYLAYAQTWRTMVRAETTLRRLKSDPHSPAPFRVNGVVRNMDEWYSAFNIKEGDALYLPPEERVSIW